MFLRKYIALLLLAGAPVAGYAACTVETFLGQNSSGNVTTMTLTDPTSMAVDDIYLILQGSDHGNPALPEHTVPTGTNTSFVEIAIHGANQADTVVSAWYHIWDGTEGTVSINQTGADNMSAFAVRVSGCDTADVLDGVSTPGDAAAATSHAILGFTTGEDDTLAFYLIGGDGADTVPHSVSGTGWSETDEHEDGNVTGGVGISFGEKSMPTAGATGTATIAFTVSDGASWFQFSLNDASAGGNTSLRRRRSVQLEQLPTPLITSSYEVWTSL